MQLNAELPEDLCKQVKKDAIETNVTINEYVRQALQRFRSLPIAQRRVYLGDRKQQKILGRKITA